MVVIVVARFVSWDLTDKYIAVDCGDVGLESKISPDDVWNLFPTQPRLFPCVTPRGFDVDIKELWVVSGELRGGWRLTIREPNATTSILKLNH
jgi:hypothetical protein